MPYIDFWRHWKDFSGKTERFDYWFACFIHICLSFALMLTCCIAFVAVFDMTAETALTYFKFVFTVYLLISSVPMLSMTVRRLRDAGYHRNNWWKLLIPGVFAIAPFLPHDPTGEDEE
jgi:uncharacterized membrane protein YhaH (DUF805 family)